MARKDRVPSPPKRPQAKRPQAPMRRQTQVDPEVAARRRRNVFFVLAGGALVAAAIVLGAIFLSGGGTNEQDALAEAGYTLQSFEGQEGTHVQSLTAKPKWNSNPPTSGRHYGTPAIWGFYREPVLLIQSVHNLEHGGIVIHYGPEVSEETIEQIRAFYDDDPNGLLVSPLPSMTPKNAITLSAWTAPERAGSGGDNGRGYLAKGTRFDEQAFSTFVEEHRYKGPERFPPDLLQPGS